MVFLSNYLVFKIVLAALGRVDYPVAGDLELKYDTANKIYLSGGSLDYVDDVTLYTTIGGETTGYDIQFNSLNLDASNEQILFASDAATNHYFGSDTAISGNYAIVGAMDEDVSGGTDSGAAYIFYKSSTTWSQQAKLKASDPATSDKFGHRVDIEGDYAIVGAYNKNSGTGAAYIFKRSGTTWTQQSKLTASNAGASDEFGRAVGISGDYAFVGARREDTGGTDRGSVYIYVRSGTTWTQHAQIQASDAQDSDNFGWALSVDGDYAVIGAYLEDTGGSNAGSAYIFYKSGTTWSQQQKIQASDKQADDRFGVSVDIKGEYVIVGAELEDTGGSNAGSAYVFVRSGTSWTQQAILRASDAQADDRFGGYDPTVSISGSFAVIGAHNEDAGGSNAGAAYVFSRSGSTWTEVKKIVASNPTASDWFGQTVAIDGTTILVGAREEDTKATAAGAAYIYTSQQVTNYYITDAGKYSVDATIAGLNYKTNEVEVTGTPSDVELYTEPETDFTASKAVLSSTSNNSYHQGGMSDNGEYYFYGQQVYKKDTGSFTYSTYGSALSSTIFSGSYSSLSHDGMYIVSYYTNSTKQLHILKNNGTTFVSHQIIASPNTSARTDSQATFVPGPLKHFLWIGKEDGSSSTTFFFYKYNSGTDNWSLDFSVTDPGAFNTDAAFLAGRGGVSFSRDGNYLAVAYNTNPGAAVFKVDWTNQTLTLKYQNSQTGFFSCFLSSDAKYFYYSTGSGTTDGKMLYSANGDWEGTPTDVTSSFTNIGNLGDHSSIFSDRYIFSEKGGSARYIFKWNDLIRPTLTFDNYNKLSLTNIPTNTSSKLFLGSNVYDIGTLTSDLTIETPGLYRGLVYDTSSNVAYFNKVTVGAIASTMVSYGKQDQVLNAGGDAGYGSGGDATQGGYGNSIDMSADGTRMVVGNAHYTDSNGRVWLYHLENGSWVLKQTWDGGTRLGSQVAMNEAGTRVFAVSPRLDSQNPGFVRIWDYSSGAWDTSASGTYSIAPGTISQEVNGVDCNKTGDVVIIGAGNSNNTWIYRLSGGSWSSEKNFPRRGSGVSMNGDGTRCFMGDRDSHKVWESNYSGGSWGTETEIIDESSFSGYWPASLSTDSAGETVCIKGGDSGNGAIYERAGNGSWSASVSGILSKTEVYGTDKVALSYDGTVAIFGHMRDSGALSTGGHALLYTKSGSTWSIAQTLLNPSSSQHSGDFFGGGTGLSKTAKDRFVVAAMGDDNAGTNYGAIYTYTNAIPDFISFDTYNKLSLSGITNPTSKIHALPTGAESTTTYDIGSATNIYIESEGTYTAEMKGSDGFALDSTVVSGTISFPSRTSYRYLALAFPRNNYENSIRTMTIEFDDGTKFDNANPPASSAFTENYAGNNATTDIFNSSTNTNYSGSSLGWSDGTWYCPFHIDCGSGFTKKVKRVTIINGQSDYQYSLIAPRLYGASSVPSTPGLAANWNYVCHVESIQRGWTLETSSYDMEPKAYRYIGLAGYRITYTMHIYEFSIELVDGTIYDSSNIPTVSSNMTVSGGSVAETIDGVWTTSGRWNSASTYTSASQQYVYLKVDLGSAKKVKHVRVWSNYTGTYTNGPNSMNYYGSSTNTSSVNAEGSSDWNRLGPIEMLKSNDTTEQTINSSLYDSKLEFDGYNKLSLNKFDPTSSTLKYFSNTYDIGTATNVYIANPGTYSAEIKGATNFALSSNVTGSLTHLGIYGAPIALPDTMSANTAWSRPSNIYFAFVRKINTSTAVTYKGGNFWNGSAYVTPNSDYSNLQYEYTDADIQFYKSGNDTKLNVNPTGSGIDGSGEPSKFKINDTGSFETDAIVTASDVIHVYDTNSSWLMAFNMHTGLMVGQLLTFDGYNKLTFSGLESGSTSNVLFNGNTYSIGTASNVYITETGTYEAESKGTTTFALTSNVVGAIQTHPNAAYANYRSIGGISALSSSLHNENISTTYSVTMWAKKINGQYFFRTTNSDSSTNPTNTHGILRWSSGKISHVTWTSNNSTGITYATTLDATSKDEWHFYGFEFEGTTTKLHLDGAAPITGTTGLNGQTHNRIRFDSSTMFSTDGARLAEFAVYNRALTDAEFVSIYNNGKPNGPDNVSSGRVSWFKCLSGAMATNSGSGGDFDCTFTEDTDVPDTWKYTPPSLTHDGYKLVVKNITPTSTSLRLGSNTYEIGSATNIYVKDTGAYTAEIGGAADFAFTSNTVSGTIKTIEPVINGGYFFGHALTYDGKLYGWGENSDGDVGVGTTSDVAVPTLCTGIPQGEVVSIWNQAKRGESRWAKTRDGRIWVTGNHDSYSLPGSSADFTTFTDVSSQFGDHTQTATSVVWASGSGRHTHVLMENGDVWSFGDDTGSAGVLGQGASPTSDRTPRKLTGISNVTKLTLDSDMTLALDSSNVVWMWGRNATGSGTNGWGPYNVPTNIMGTGTANLTSLLVSGETVTDIECSYYSMFAITSKGTVYCTGTNPSGELGQGGTTAKTSSDGWVKIEYFTSNAITVNKLYVGDASETAHIFADTSDGWYCWGDNSVGQLGLGDTTDKTSPVKFTGVSNIKKFGKGYGVSYTVTEDGKYYAWGLGGSNWVRGDNATGNISYPKYIDTLPNILAPSFEFDGYDKVFVNKDGGIKTWTSGPSTIDAIPGIGSWIGLMPLHKVYDDGVYAGYSIQGFTEQLLHYTYATKIWSDPTSSHPDYITSNTDDPTINESTPNAKTLVGMGNNGNIFFKFNNPFYSDSFENTKYTKGTTTYDVGKASIITVPDTGTYDAQLKSKFNFTLKSATVPATKASGLYTWAFHHGNFDNAYGDGDILTARDNGRFYADTPAFTGDIGTITPTSVSSFVYKVYCTVLPGPTTGHTTDANDTSWNLTEISSTTTTLTSAMFEMADPNYVDSSNGIQSVLFNGNINASAGHFGIKKYNEGGLAVDRHMFTITTPVELLQLSISTHRPGYMPGIKIILNDTHTLINETSNQGTSATPSPYTKSHTFSSNYLSPTHGTTYTFASASALTANVLMVAGGGGGGPTSGGSSAGGGAGGLVYTAGTTLSGTKTIVVGNGGTNHINGNDTTFTSLTTTVGGGRGATAGETGGNGGSGGGTSHHYPSSPGTGVSGQGNAGGNAGNNSYRNGGGGGGAGGVGGNASTSSQLGGVGGIGLNYSSTFGSFYGESGWFAGGGAGCSNQTATPAVGGIGGGGYSGTDVSTANALSGQSHTGGGGGGAGGKGGSGIVLLQTNVATPNVNSEVKIPGPDGFLNMDYDNQTIGRGPIPSSNSSRTIVNQPLPDGSEGPVYYSASTYTYFGVNQGNTNQGDGSFQTMESVYMPIQTGAQYTHVGYFGDDGNMMAWGITSDMKLYLHYGSFSSISTLTISNDVVFKAGKWHHVVLTVDYLGNSKAYVNGYLVASGRWSGMNADKSTAMFYRTGVMNHPNTNRTYMASTSRCYYSELSPKEIMQLASSVGLGPKLEYDGLNTIKILNTEPGSSVKLFTSNVADTSNVFIVADPAAGEYTVPEAGKYYAEIKGTDTFTITKTLDVSGTFPLYQYPPYDGTTSSLTQSASADTWNTWTISGASNGNGQYQAKTTHAPHSSSFTVYRAFNNDVSDDNGQYVDASQKINVGLTLQLPSAKTIRKYRMYPVDHSLSSGAIPGSSTDPTLSGGDPDYKSRPKSWILKGSSDGTNWTDLDTVTNKPISIYGDVYSIDSPASYQYYQMFVVNIVDTSALLRIGEWQLWGDA